ncbi:MAG: TIGR01777 family oxidoreductase [Myxococcota bacterium]|nr:TIGR01777 family oxidoreductase [Myxococcota bacterium]
MKVLLSGATGLIGRHLVSRVGPVRALVRDVRQARRSLGDVDAVAWDSNAAVPRGAARDVNTVFHLAGEPLGGRLTEARKQLIRDSRVLGTRRIVEALREADPKPRVLVCASAVGIYGSRGDESLTEESSLGSDFLADICRDWEKEALAAKALGIRVVCARMGIVLCADGGALSSIRPAFRLGVGGPLGSGKQWMPWIHIEDVVGLLLHAASHSEVEGPFNVCAAEPIRNVDFSRTLGRVMHRPSLLRAPAAALKIALGDMADVVLASTRAIPAKAIASGYAFKFTGLEQALSNVMAAGQATAPRV